MAVKSRTLTRDGKPFPFNKLMAGFAQFLSFLTTLWFVEWVWPEGGGLARFAIALVAEGILLAFKSSLWQGESHGMSWTGFGIDTILNAGGVLPITSRMLLFPPLAAVLGAMGVLPYSAATMATVAGNVVSYGGFLLAIIGGILLSVAPHYLWTHGGNDGRTAD